MDEGIEWAKKNNLYVIIEDWDFNPTTQGRFFKTYLQSMKDKQ